ncbi:MAG: phosphoribosylamine--glycine ligase [Actinobacteria bacterium]|nr:phosphoribosylamine--glycine ligase [Actinomycetota bacterium]
MKVLVIGGGGREHCLAWKITASDLVDKVYAAPGNAGISSIAECVKMGAGARDFDLIADFVEANGIGLVVVGPEAPLVEGIADYLKSRGILTFGPNRDAAMLEGSKVFTRDLLSKYNIPKPEGSVFEKTQYDEAVAYIKKQNKFPLVIKADGLAAGKGVLIVQDIMEAIRALDECMVDRVFGSSGDRVIIEDFLTGYETSILCLSDGKKIIPMELAQDYKRIFDGDEGKNTGGMGSYSPVPMISSSIYEKALDTIIHPTAAALKKENIDYRGILYAGILVSEDKPYILEYNCRFGDPETQAVLPRLKDDLVPLLIGCAEGSLGTNSLSWSQDKCICVVAASRGYPDTSSKGDIITGLDNFDGSDDVIVFHSGTKKQNSSGSGSRIITDGGRVLGLSAMAAGFKEARKKAYNAMSKISFDGIQYRKDIAEKAEEDGR